MPSHKSCRMRSPSPRGTSPPAVHTQSVYGPATSWAYPAKVRDIDKGIELLPNEFGHSFDIRHPTPRGRYSVRMGGKPAIEDLMKTVQERIESEEMLIER